MNRDPRARLSDACEMQQHADCDGKYAKHCGCDCHEEGLTDGPA